MAKTCIIDVLGSLEMLVKFVSTVVPVYLLYFYELAENVPSSEYIPQEFNERSLGEDDASRVPVQHAFVSQ